jgi:hypothetical protein
MHLGMLCEKPKEIIAADEGEHPRISSRASPSSATVTRVAGIGDAPPQDAYVPANHVAKQEPNGLGRVVRALLERSSTTQN